jgi:hypothetical protein
MPIYLGVCQARHTDRAFRPRFIDDRYAEPSPSIPAPPIPTLRIDPSSISNPTDPNDPTSTTTPIAFGNYSFPNSLSHLPSNPRDGLGMQEGTSREEEMVKPRGSAVRSSGDGGYSEGGSGVGERQGTRWDLDGLKEDKVEVNTCE